MSMNQTSPLEFLKRSDGIALFVAILVMTIVMIFISASLFLSRVDTKITSSFKLETQALQVADAGLQHAVALTPWVWDFDSQLACGTPPCTLVANSPFPAGSGFRYTVTAENDVPDINNGGTPTNDTNALIVLTSKAEGPSSSTRTVEAYVRRSLASFTPPSSLYINASSASPAIGGLFFDDDDSLRIIGNDTNPGNLLDGNDDNTGPNPSLLGIATTSDNVTNALRDEYINPYPNTFDAIVNHDILGVGPEPSISTRTDDLDISQIADNFFNDPGAVKYLDGLVTSGCTSSSPCLFGTSSTPQITYIKDNTTSSTQLRGHVRGYGVLDVEGRTTIGGDFRFKGLVIHKKSDTPHYISFEDRAWVYGSVLFGSTDGNVTFRVEDFSRLFYSSEALAIVDSNWGSLLPRPARIFAWVDK